MQYKLPCNFSQQFLKLTAKQRRRFVQIVATVDRHAHLMYSHIELRSLSTNLRRAERPCGGCWGCSPQRCVLDAASSRTLGSPTAMWFSCGSTKSRTCSTACARHRACGRKIRRCPTYFSYITTPNKRVTGNNPIPLLSLLRSRLSPSNNNWSCDKV